MYKKILFLFMSLTIIFSCANMIVAEETAAGSTLDNPISITTAAELSKATEDKYYRLKKDINITSSAASMNNISFKGHLDGNGFKITSSSGKALFAENRGTIENLTLETLNKHKSAGLTEKNTGVITNCFVTVNVSLDKTNSVSHTSGIAAANTGTIEKCRTIIKGSIRNDNLSTGTVFISGIAHNNTDGIIRNSMSEITLTEICLSSSSVNPFPMTLEYAGISFKGGDVTNCYAENNITYTTSGNGATSITLYGISPNPQNCIYTSANNTVLSGGTKVSSITGQRPTGWDFTNIWTSDTDFNDNKPYLIPSKLTLLPNSVSMYVSEQKQLSLKYYGAALINENKIIYKSSNENTASVDSSGKITAKGEGTAVITADFKGLKTTSTITVPKAADSITLDKNEINLYIGKTYTIKPAISPDDAETGAITYSSSDTSIALVSGTGVITPVSVGNTDITVTVQNGGKSAVLKVSVLQPSESIKLNLTSKTINIGESFEVSAEILPQNTHDKTVLWESNNDNVKIVKKGETTESAVITALKAGRTTLTAKTKDTGLSAEIKIIILAETEGEGTKENPYVITSPEQLMDIGSRLDSSYILGKNLDMAGVEFESIGSAKTPFTGTFDGNNFEIKNLNINGGSNSETGLFGGSSGSISNLTVSDAYITSSGANTGIIAGNNTGTISNCKTSGTVRVNSQSSVYAGGIAGFSAGEITGCTYLDSDGYIYADSSSKDAYAGGIAGSANTVASSESYGSVIANAPKGTDYAGGIAGTSLKTVSDCKNFGSVSAISFTGGISGLLDDSCIVENCINEGGLENSTTGGGIAGLMKKASISNCKNTSSIALEKNAGGIAGSSTGGTIKNCKNTGKISALTAGGIIGSNGSSSSSASIISCKNFASISAQLKKSLSSSAENVSAGGIAGINYGMIITSANKGPIMVLSDTDIKSSASLNAGGIAGYSKGVLNTNYNNGAVYAYSVEKTMREQTNAGGITGYSLSSVSNCYNTASVSGVGNIGGIIGTLKDSDISKCYNTGTVSSSKESSNNIGGIIGHQYNSKGTNFYYLDSAAKEGIGNQTTTQIASASSSKTEAQMKKEITFIGFPFDKTWGINAEINNGFPYLKEISYDDSEIPDVPNIPNIPDVPDIPNPDDPDTPPAAENFYTISEITLKSTSNKKLQSIPSGNFIAEITVNENTKRQNKDYVIIAAYDSNSKLTSFNYIITDISDTASFGVLLSNNNSNISKIKAFVLDNLDSMSPLSNSSVF